MSILSIIILQYNNSQLTVDLLQSIRENEPDTSGWNIYVVDNNSTDEDRFGLINKTFPEVITIKNPSNLGFAGGINQVARTVSTRFILLINNDMVLVNNAISLTLNEIILRNGDAITCKIIGKDGFVQNTSNTRLNTLNLMLSLLGYLKIRAYWRNRLNRTTTVGYINGAFLLVKLDIYKKTGMMDESFFMYGEDIDLMLRFNKAKTRMFYCPRGIIVHYDGASAKKVWNASDKYLLKLKNSLRAHKKNKTTLSFLILKIVLAVKEIVKFSISGKETYLKATKLIYQY